MPRPSPLCNRIIASLDYFSVRRVENSGTQVEIAPEVRLMAPTERALKRLLLVEDDPGDVMLARECLTCMDEPIHLDVVEDGVAALAFLRQEPGYLNSMRPDLVIMDLNLPRRDGRMVLKEMKEDDHLRSIPVVVLTTSKSDEDVRAAYQLGGNCYIAKPSGLLEYESVMRKLGDFWLNTVRLPET